MLVMIPTRHKARLSHQLSYPIGAGRITAALADAPHADELSLSFRDAAVWPASEFNRILTQHLPYAILVAQYWPETKPGYIGSRSMAEAGHFDERWEIEVYPVLRHHRHIALQLLLRGLPAIARWLASSCRRGWKSQRRSIRLVFNPLGGSLDEEETDGSA